MLRRWRRLRVPSSKFAGFARRVGRGVGGWGLLGIVKLVAYSRGYFVI